MFSVARITGHLGGTPAHRPIGQRKSIRALVRNVEEATQWAERGVQLRQGDLSDAHALTSAMAFLAPADDDGFHIELATGPGAVDRPSHEDLHDSLGLHGWRHVCLRVDSIDDTVAKLKRPDVTIVAGPP